MGLMGFQTSQKSLSYMNFLAFFFFFHAHTISCSLNSLYFSDQDKQSLFSNDYSSPRLPFTQRMQKSEPLYSHFTAAMH